MNTEETLVKVTKKRGRPTLDRMVVLSAFVTALKTKYGETGPYTRDQLEDIGDTNQLGMKLFTSKKDGYGNYTRLSHGSYVIPASWATNPPWSLNVVVSE